MTYAKEFLFVVIFCLICEAQAFDNGVRTFSKINEGALAMGFMAKEMCSCLFVTEQPEAYCRDYVQFGELKKINANIQINLKDKTVRASTFLVITKVAEYQSDKLGCQLVR